MIKTEKLIKKYGDFVALNELSLQVKSGEIYCLLGANGAGKSTTINLLLGFLKATSGTALINGKDVEKNNLETKKDIAYIPENLMLYPTLNAVENLDYFSGIGGQNLKKEQLESL